MRRLARLCAPLLGLAILAGLAGLIWPAPAAAELTWVRYKGRLPEGAVRAGFVPESDLYVCRGKHRDGVHPGKFFNGRCNVGWGGHEVSLEDFEILVDRDQVRWVPESPQPPAWLFAAGQGPAGELAVCRVFHRDGVHIGELRQGRCSIGWGGRELGVAPFELLVGGGFVWTPARDGELPAGAVGGGMVREGELFVCRARLDDGLHVGKYWRGRCNVGHRGREELVRDFEVLVRPSGGYAWRRGRAGLGTGGCLVAGRAQGQDLCICRGRHRDGLHIGKTWAGRCQIGWGGQEVGLDEFEVLVGR
ncbi:MAG: DM9 repeat-containing protein [Pseudomonadota bacterium]